MSDNKIRKNDKAIVAGIDIGTVSCKAVILMNGEPVSFSETKTRIPKDSAIRVINDAGNKVDLKLDDIHYIVATGCGRSQVSFAHRTVSEISCAAKGVINIWGPSVRTILDAGGESCKVIHCTEKGRVIDFLWNDKCSSGIGLSIEILASLVNKELTEIGKIATEHDEFPRISDFCAVYARSETFDLVKDRVSTEKIITAYHYAMAKRIGILVERLGLKKDFVVIGGMARNPGIMRWLKNILKINFINPKVELDPTMAVAFGAALFADDFL